MKDWFKALFGYTAGNILSVLSFVFAAAVFYTVFWLYGVETEPVLYATLISAVILLIVFVLRFSSVYKKHKRLEKIKNDAEYAVLKLPDYNDPIKKDLADIAEKMSALKTDAETRMNRKYSDSADYFTLWAHQIKTPIAAMRLLLQTDCSPENDELEEQLFKIEQYVEMVLQYIRSDSISSDLEIKSYDLGGIVRAAVKKYRKQFLRKKTKVIVGDINCRVLAAVLGCAVPSSNEEKTALLHSHNIALWDIIKSCDIVGSSDSSIKNVVPNDIGTILSSCGIRQIYSNGKTSEKLFNKYIKDTVGRDTVALPSTSPANASYNLERLTDSWSVIKNNIR